MKKSILICCLIGISLPLFAKWDTTTDVDKMTDKKSAYATSSYISSSDPMNFPYNNIKSFIGVGCTETSSWAYIGFSDSPNLINTKTERGYSVIESRIKFDDKVEETTLRQDWGSKFIHFIDREDIINKVKESKKLLLELNWYGNGLTYFEFNLEGANEAINSIYDSCGYKNKTTETVTESKKQIILKSKTLVKQKKECLEVGGKYDWDFKKDIFRCIAK